MSKKMRRDAAPPDDERVEFVYGGERWITAVAEAA
jgi:hypothetical protein